jgi:hypothetical protein
MEHAYVSSIQSMRVSFAVLRILAEGSCDYVGNNITKEIGG